MEISGDLLDLLLYGTCNKKLLNIHTTWAAQQLLLPEEVCILPSTVPGASYGVFCTNIVKKGTEIGPYPGHLVSTLDETTSARAWEIYNSNGAFLGFMDGGQSYGNWLTNVQCARSAREQNLEVVQIGSDIFYRAIKDIVRGQELLVWYGGTYILYMGIPSYYRKDAVDTSRNYQTEVTHEKIQTNKQKRSSNNVGKWHCVLCQRHFNSRSNLRSHMRIHTLEKPFCCKFCARKFSQSSTLRNHIRLHTGEKPYRCLQCNSSYSQLAGLRAHQRSATHNPSQKPSV